MKKQRKIVIAVSGLIIAVIIVFIKKNEGEVQDWYEQIKKIRNDIDMKE